MSTQILTSLWTQSKTWREALIWIKTDTSILMNSWRHLDSSTVRTRLLKHRLCLWNAHHPWTRYILFLSLCSVLVSFLYRNAQQMSRTTKGPKWNPSQVLLCTTESQVTELPGTAENPDRRKKHRGTIASKQHSTDHSSSFFQTRAFA